MKRLLILAAAVMATVATPVLAQNAGQIARVRGGTSCPGCNLFQGDFGGLEARGLNLAGARLRQADLSLSVMNRTRFSNTDMRGNTRRPSGESAMPRATISGVSRRSMRSPSNQISPLSIGCSAMIAFSVLDLPAPLDPISETISPVPISSDTPFSARRPP